MRTIAKMHLAYDRAVRAIKNAKGQNTIEYMLMLFVIIGVVFAVGAILKGYMPELFNTIKAKITGSAAAMDN